MCEGYSLSFNIVNVYFNISISSFWGSTVLPYRTLILRATVLFVASYTDPKNRPNLIPGSTDILYCSCSATPA